MTCNCLETINEKLKPDHTLHATMLLQGGDRPIIPLIRRDTWQTEKRRGRRSSILPTFCPFCGTRYEPEPAMPAGDREEPTHG